MATIIYTHTDEAPLLATYSLPADHRRRTPSTAGVDVETRDISLAGRILALFPDLLDAGAADRRRARRARRPGQDARGQHHQAAQHQRLGPAAQGRDRRAAGAGLRPARLPGRARRPTRRRTSAPATTRSRAAPSTRCCARATPTAARRRRSRATPARTRTRWARGRSDSKTNVAHMGADDFRSNEKSVVIEADGTLAHRARRPTTAPSRCSRTRSRCWPARSSTPPS